MAAPSITVLNTDNEPIINWDAGVVQSSNDSKVLTCKIWNNREGTTALSDLRNVTITTLDLDNTATSDVVVNHWLGVRCYAIDGANGDFTQVGGTVGKGIRSDAGSTDPAGEDYNIIKGSANNGNETESPENVATVDLRFRVPDNVPAGTRDVKIRIMGIYT